LRQERWGFGSIAIPFSALDRLANTADPASIGGQLLHILLISDA
jgi:hypothetical protein